ncbi:hypothetical protein ACFVGN_34340 [Streptomyces sp. NPDC057757]|uniref:hypothetical protein n=1 Tax=Streptomyces sp. NPDC057757 TaxID=3346241 RepID=UPI00367C350E
MATKPARPLSEAGQRWLLSCAPDPADVQRRWAAEELAPFATGAHWRVAEVPLLPTMDALQRIGSGRLGPVLADVEMQMAWWLLHASVGDELDDVRQLTVHRVGWVLSCPPVLYSLDGRLWLERPDGSGRLTDPILLGAALGPGGGPRLSAEALG